MVSKETLDNGIRVITEKIREAHSVAIGIWVENGSRHETPSLNGISHFIEHMLFKGTERRNALDIAKGIDAVGGLLNAFTSREYSCYYAKVLGKDLPFAIDLLADIVLHSVFDLDELEKERRVILQEIHMVEDTPEDYVHDLFSQAFWKGHPLGLSVLGTGDTVGRLEREEMLSFLKERYCGRNIIIAAAGNVDHEAIVEAIAQAFGSVPSGPLSGVCAFPRYQRDLEFLNKDLEQVHICLGTKALPQSHPRRYEAYVLNTLLGSSMSSRLFQKVREERALAYSIYSYLNAHSDAGALVVYAGTAPDQATEVVGLILQEIRRLKQEPVSEEELASAREQLKGNLLLSMESTDNRMTRLAKNEIYFGRHLSLHEVLGGFDRVTREGLRELAQEIFRDEYLNIQLMGRIDERQFPLIDLTLE